jgi:hypothetical protein
MKSRLTPEMESLYWDLVKIHQSHWNEMSFDDQLAMIGQLAGQLGIHENQPCERVCEIIVNNAKTIYDLGGTKKVLHS